MALVHVRLPSLLEPITGTRSVTVEAATVAEAVAALIEAEPRLRVHLYDEQGRRRLHVRLFWNDDDIDWLDGDPVAHDGDVLTVMQAVSGG
jgi:molybdopterin converting factor small subunit